MIITLTLAWVVLMERLTIATALVGLAVSACCVFFTRRVIPLQKSEPVKIFRLVIYFFYLLGQIYLGGIAGIKVILFGANVEIVEIQTHIRNKTLQTVLFNSVTLVPGSVSLDLKSDTMTVLWLTNKAHGPPPVENSGEVIKGRLERLLLKAQKEDKNID